MAQPQSVSHIPKRIYKYYPPSALALTGVSSSQIWFSDPLKFNDPYDCAFDLIDNSIWESRRKLTRKDCLKLIGEDPGRKVADADLQDAVSKAIRESVRQHFVNFGVSCCAASNKSLLMWSHYAESHRGFCLEFDTAYPPFSDAMAVNYADSFPHFDWKTILQNKKPVLVNYLLTKARCWKYEEEWRMINRYPNCLVSYSSKALTGIYFGAMTPVEQLKMISKVVPPEITRYQMGMRLDSFELLDTAYSVV